MAVTDDFQSVGSILLNMDSASKEKLFAKAKECMNKASIDDIGKLNEAIKDPDMKTKLLKVIVDHVESQLEMQIVDWVIGRHVVSKTFIFWVVQRDCYYVFCTAKSQLSLSNVLEL